MTNREVYSKEPKANRILNQGVAEVAEEYNEDALAVLRYELETFICEGQYKKGLELVVGSYLQHLASDAPVQKGVWISGFYGSGKSHLVKMLRVLWTDFAFLDGASARGIAILPEDIRDQLKELAVAAKRNGGGTFAAAGKMGGGGGESVRLILLGILFKAAGFPEQYAQARFLLWLRHEGKLEAFKDRIASAGKDLRSELGHLYVSTLIGKTLVDLFPGQFQDVDAVQDRLAAQFSQPADISDDELVTTIKDLLASDGKMPLTLVVLDELQQYIGIDPNRAYKVQLVAETLCNHFKSRLLLVGTGQSALADTPNLQRLMARFPLPVQLSENDVDRVIRRNILAKKSSAEATLRDHLAGRSGEIARHLQGTVLAHSSDDDRDLVSDYPLLPTRRRFWEHVLRSVDPTGTTAQLRNQLRIVDEAVLATAEYPIGTIVAGDFIFDQISANLVSSQALSRESYNRITTLSGSSKDEERLLARLLKLVFLINKLPTEASVDTKLRATSDSLVDLLVEKLEGDAERLKQSIPGLLEKLAASHDLMSLEGPAGTEYRLQTRESAEWYDDFKAHESKLKGNSNIVNVKRDERIKKWFDERKSGFTVRQGKTGTIRNVDIHYGVQRPADASKKLTLWVRDGFTTAEATALAEARALKTEWPVVIAYLPDDLSSELFTAIVTIEAAKATIQGRGVPKTAQGDEAQKSISSRLTAAEADVGRYLETTMQRAKVWLSGGSEITNGIGLEAQVGYGLETAAARLFSKFSEGDRAEWAEVVKKGQKGDREALKAIGYSGEPTREPVCGKVLDEIGAGMKGAELRSTFSEAPYGWPQDAIDGALYALLANETITATDAGNHAVSFTAVTLNRAKIGQTNFYREDAPLSTAERLAL
ncbi:MAG: BREX system P-loop protein BrxC, partial [Spirochaetota bacterium]